MNSENIQLAQMDIIRQVLNVSDMNILERIKTFLVNSKEGDDVYAKNNRISVKLQKILMKLVKNIRMVRLFISECSRCSAMDGISMKYQIDFSKKAEKVIRKWKKSNPALFKKLYDLLPELEKHPETGTGHPEPLVGGNSVTYSRHITAHDRIIYDIYRNEVVVLIVKAEGHYKDK